MFKCIVLTAKYSLTLGQTCFSPQWNNTCSWKQISMTSPSPMRYEWILRTHEYHAPEQHMHSICVYQTFFNLCVYNLKTGH